ncbi:MAG: dimethyl sulfoxide reductase anchor subunit [Candidatus Rokubacteria bacterium]|nr:dimethyl sulfoxide reductase anchor subunit [Candidatus Rokubacteria bacterium]
MTALGPPAELIPARPQTLWGWPAVANFALGGLGAGLYVAAAVGAGLGVSPAVRIAAWLGPALVLAGFAAVATEAGRPLRGPRVLTRVLTSWMSRELWLGGAFVLLAAAELVAPGPVPRLGAALAAAALALAQGFILRRARGIAAWDVPPMPLVFLASALVSGTGLWILVEVAGGRPLGGGALGLILLVLVGGAFVWLAYVTWSREDAFVKALAPLSADGAAIELVGLGYVLPVALVALGLAVPAWVRVTMPLAAALMIAGQVRAKAALVLRAGQLRPIALPHLRLSRRSP